MKKFATPIQLLDVDNEGTIGTPSNGMLIYSIDGHVYEKRPDSSIYKILTTEDLMYKSASVNGNTTLSAFVPAKYKIVSIVADGDPTHKVEELTISSFAGGNDIVLEVDIDRLRDLPIGKSLFSLSGPTTLSFSGTKWVNSITFHFKLERVAV